MMETIRSRKISGPSHARAVNLGAVERIPLGEGREFEIEGEAVVVFRSRDETLYAVQAKCPHRGGALADGMIGAGKVICPFHSFKFDLMTGAPIGNDCAALRTFAVSINEDGEMLLGGGTRLEFRLQANGVQ